MLIHAYLVGTLGFTTTYYYPHTSSVLRHNIEEQLKGMDMLVFQVFKLLGYNVRVTSVIDDSDYPRDDKRKRYKAVYAEADRYRPDEELPDTTLCYIGRRLHSLIILDEADDCSHASPGKFHFDWPGYQEREDATDGYAAYDRIRVAWLNGDPLHRASELALSTIVVSLQPQAYRPSD